MPAAARFTEGSTFRHVVVMTLTGAMGLTFMFLIDAATLFWLARLGEERLVAGLGFAWTVIFFIISSGIGLAVAATALVSRALGEGDLEGARIGATSALVITFSCRPRWRRSSSPSAIRCSPPPAPEGETAAAASRFLLVTSPAMPFMALGMTGASILRAAGDAWRSMAVTLVAGMIAMLLDPVFILLLDFRLEGAAWVMVAARGSSGVLAIWYLVRVHRLLAPVDVRGRSPASRGRSSPSRCRRRDPALDPVRQLPADRARSPGTGTARSPDGRW